MKNIPPAFRIGISVYIYIYIHDTQAPKHTQDTQPPPHRYYTTTNEPESDTTSLHTAATRWISNWDIPLNVADAPQT